MRKISTYLLSITAAIISTHAVAQVSAPFVTCPNTTVAVIRNGLNDYNNEPVTFYNVNVGTGATTALPGGPLKNPANTATNIDMNAMGLNQADGYLYGMNPGITTTPKFYRMGSNYSIQQVGVIPPPAIGFLQVSAVNSAAGEFDNQGNYYFTAIKGRLAFLQLSFIPTDFYIGKIAGAAGLPAGAGAIATSYKKINFNTASCNEFVSTITAPISFDYASNTGLKDIAYNAKDGKLYTYVTFEYPAGSGIFKGQLFSVDPGTGNATCFPSAVLPYANSSNEVAGVAISFNGDMDILFTGGTIYKADAAGVGIYTGSISLLNPTATPAPLRGDLASCGAASAGPTPVTFESITTSENNCTLTFKWTIAQETNVNHYELEILNSNGTFSRAGTVPAVNDANRNVYSLKLPVEGKNVVARVKAVDNDGKVTYSPVTSLATTCTTGPRIAVLNSYDVQSTLTVRWSNIAAAGSYSATILNATGAVVSKQQLFINAGQSVTTTNIVRLPAGTYIYVASNNEVKYTATFVKK